MSPENGCWTLDAATVCSCAHLPIVARTSSVLTQIAACWSRQQRGQDDVASARPLSRRRGHCSLRRLRRVGRGAGGRAGVAPRRAFGDWRTRTVEYLGCAPTRARVVGGPVVEGDAISDGSRLALAHRGCGFLSRRRSWRRLLSAGHLACAGFGSGRRMVRPRDDRWCGIHRTCRQEGDSLTAV